MKPTTTRPSDTPAGRPPPSWSAGGAEPPIEAQRGVVRGHVVAATNALQERIAGPWTLDALAAEVHLSRSQLVRAFDATVGTSPMAYLRRMRVERMAQLLVSTDLSVGEAARRQHATPPRIT